MKTAARKIENDTHGIGHNGSNSSAKAVLQIDPLNRYLYEIKRYRLLKPDEQRELAIRFKENDDHEAAQMLVVSNLRLVFKIAMEFQIIWMQNLLDLIQEGNIGLMQAAVKFDPYRNVKFSYYASFWIKAYILKFIMDNWRLVKIGTTQGQRTLFFNLNKEKQKLIKEGFEPTPKLLSEKLGFSNKQVIEMDQRLNGRDVSLDAPLSDESDTEISNFIPSGDKSPEDQICKEEIKSLLNDKIDKFKNTITPREWDIFDNRIYSEDPLTLQQLGHRHNISRERVRQVEKEVIHKIKLYFRSEIPDFDQLSLHENFNA
jgi:RNA polymerase sigma-32 factor